MCFPGPLWRVVFHYSVSSIFSLYSTQRKPHPFKNVLYNNIINIRTTLILLSKRKEQMKKSLFSLMLTLLLPIGHCVSDAQADQSPNEFLTLPYKGFVMAISSEYRAIEMNKRITCPAADGALLWASDWHDKFIVDLSTNITGHLTIWRESDIRLNKSPLTPISDQIFSGTQRFILDTKVLNTDIFAFIDCRNTNGIINAKITRDGLRSGIEGHGLGLFLLKSLVDKIPNGYKWPNIKITLAPCGNVNAYSSPDIFLCTELVGDLLQKKFSEALTPIFLHELGHSVLKIWGLPGYDNEDFADEFATFILASTPDGPAALSAYIKWLEAQDSVSEAVTQLYVGDRHTISLQRARNIQNSLRRPQEIKARWRKLLKAYEKSNKEASGA